MMGRGKQFQNDAQSWIVFSRDLLSTIEELAYQREHSPPELLQKHVLLCKHGKMTGPVNRGESFARGMQ